MTEDASKGRLISGIGGGVLIVSLFLAWYTVKTGPISVSGSGWEALGLGDILLFLIGLIALAPLVADRAGFEIELEIDQGLVTLAAGAVALLEIVYRILNKPFDYDGIKVQGIEIDYGVSLGFGIFVALVAAAAITYGGWVQKQADEPSSDVFGQAPPPAPTYTDPAGAPPAAPPQAPPAPPQPPATPPPAPPDPPPAV